MKLTRSQFSAEGIFGTLVDGESVYATLEHAFPNSEESAYAPATPAGTYTCVKGTHMLEGMSQNFLAYELQNVKGHSGILIHVGNVNGDSSGCILIGMARQGNVIIQSRVAFQKFMSIHLRDNKLELEICDS